MPLSDLIEDLKRHLHISTRHEDPEPDDPDAPFAMVGAPVRPRRPLGHSSVAVQPEP